MVALTDNLLLQVASVIRDEVTTTDELIPSGETASYRSNPYKISEFTLIRKDPHYVGNAKAIQKYETARRNGDAKKTAEVYEVLKAAGVTADTEELMKTTGIGSVLMQNAQVTVLQENMQPAARRFLEDLPISVLSMQPSVTAATV